MRIDATFHLKAISRRSHNGLDYCINKKYLHWPNISAQLRQLQRIEIHSVFQ